jgi:hypothetical protein
MVVLPTMKLALIGIGIITCMNAACSNDREGVAKCIAGASVECACIGGGTGAQVCRSDGTFAPCECAATSQEAKSPATSPAAASRKLTKYQAKKRTAEAGQFVKKLYDGARRYYMDTPNPGFTPISPQFPVSSMGPTPPLGTCCKQGGRCLPDKALWTDDVWIALQFSVDDPHYYSYEYMANDPHTSFTVRAYGDLDCDGVYSTFEMVGSVDFGDGPAGTAKLRTLNELE